MAAPTTAPPITVPPEVHAFAVESGVAPYLPAVVELTPRVFPTARRYAVRATDDPEIATDRHIVFIVEVALDIPQAQAAERQWTVGLFASCPAPLVHVFRLRLDLP